MCKPGYFLFLSSYFLKNPHNKNIILSTEPIFINQKFTERFPALASRDFRLFLSGQAISVIGTMMQNTVQPHPGAPDITGQPFYLGLVGFASALPAALFTLPGGVLVERMDKRKLVIFLQAVFTIQALVMGILALTGVITIWHIIALAMVNGIAQAIEIPARQSMPTTSRGAIGSAQRHRPAIYRV